MHQIQIDSFADNPFASRFRRANQLRREFQHRVFAEISGELLIGQLHPIASHSRKPDLKFVSLWADGFHLNSLTRRLRRNHHGLRREIKRHAEHICILHIKQPILVEVVRLAAQRTAYYLFAEQLRSEGAHAHHMADGVGIPSLGEHRNRHNAANRLAKLLWLAYRVHHLAEQILVANVLGLLAAARALDYFTAEPLYLVSSYLSEIRV